MSARRHPRSCNELGVCQSRQPACQGCFAFAPGVIEGGPRRRRWLSDRRVEQLARAALVLALLATLATALYLAADLQLLEGVL